MTLEGDDSDGREDGTEADGLPADGTPTRRGLLTGIGGLGTAGGLALLAGCLDGDAEQDSEDDDFELEDADEAEDEDQAEDTDTSDDSNESDDDDETDTHEDDGTEDAQQSDGGGGDDDEEAGEDDTGEPEESGDESEHEDLSVEFDACARVEITGSFDDGDVAYASTGFYDDGLFGNTLLEDGVAFGNDVDAPFSGTVVMELGDGRDVTVDDDEIVVTIPEYGSDGTVITGVTTDPDDAAVAGITHANPNAEACLEELETERVEVAYDVDILETNAPVDAGAFLEVTAEIRNVTDGDGSQVVHLLVGDDGEIVDRTTVDLEGGQTDTVTLGYETASVASDQEFPVTVESADDADTVEVLVYGTE